MPLLPLAPLLYGAFKLAVVKGAVYGAYKIVRSVQDAKAGQSENAKPESKGDDAPPPPEQGL